MDEGVPLRRGCPGCHHHDWLDTAGNRIDPTHREHLRRVPFWPGPVHPSAMKDVEFEATYQKHCVPK
jgi:hypothetical protein